MILVNMMNENGTISRSHGLPFYLLKQQADALELPIIAIPTSWKDYEKKFIDNLRNIQLEYKVDAMVFGDIDLQSHRDWEEMVCEKSGIQAILPLWQRDRKELLLEMLSRGMQTMIVSCNLVLGEEFLGKIMDVDIIPELEARGVDTCGENGEFHTIVLNCPLFKQEVKLPGYTKVRHEDYWFIQWGGGDDRPLTIDH